MLAQSNLARQIVISSSFAISTLVAAVIYQYLGWHSVYVFHLYILHWLCFLPLK